MSTGPRIRIARIIARLNVGGPARHVVWLTEGLNDDEFETVLITGTVAAGEQDMADFAAAHGVNPMVLPEMSREISPRDVITVWKLFGFFRRYRPDIVHTHTAKAGAVGRAAGLLYRLVSGRRCRFIHTYHGHIFHSYYGRWKTRMFLGIERVLARLNTDRIVVLSEQQRQEIHETFRVGRRDQFVIIPLGVDFDALTGDGAALRRDLGIGEDELVIGIVGRLTAIKNIALFLEAADRLRDAARFVVYGDGELRAALEARAREFALGDRVVFAGTRAAGDIYAATDIVALTSLNEGTPLALIEAMACGRPVISTAVGGVVDLLGDVHERGDDGADVRERGITVASGDAAALAAGLSRLIAEPALRARFAGAGRAFARRQFSKERLLADIMRLAREFARSSDPSKH
jgi:glycosyltransferase involved in cell wall biosynthesis